MHPDPGPGQDALELVVVVLLGRAEEPVVGADGLGHRQPGGDVLARDGPGRLEQQPARRRRRRGCAGCRPDPRSAPGWQRRCGSRWPRCPGRPSSLSRPVVDGHVHPGRVIGWGREAGELIPLPGQVVMAEDGGSSGQGGGDRVRGGRVERERAQVLDHHQGGVRPAPRPGRPARAAGRAARSANRRRPDRAAPRRPGPSRPRCGPRNPSIRSAHCHFSASIETPSGPPRR